MQQHNLNWPWLKSVTEKESTHGRVMAKNETLRKACGMHDFCLLSYFAVASNAPRTATSNKTKVRSFQSLQGMKENTSGREGNSVDGQNIG